MRMTILFRWLATLWFAGLIIFSAGQLAAQTEEKLLDDINQLPEAERQARLVDGAKKEGDRHVVRRDEPRLCPRSDQRF